MLRHTVCCISLATMLFALPAASICAEHPGNNPGKNAAQGVPASGLPSTLHLNDAQRETVRKGVETKHSDIEFQLKTTKPAKDFTPSVGATLPKGVKGQSLPSEVLAQIPELRNYLYVTMKDQVLIVDGMSHKIVDMFSETQPL